jgi:hypothetical protein
MYRERQANISYFYSLIIMVIFANWLMLPTAEADDYIKSFTTIVESFTNNQYNQDYFDINTIGTGPSAAVNSERLEMNLPAISVTNGSGSYGCMFITQFGVAGDFDVQVDFNLLTWPTLNGSAQISANNCEVSRRNFGNEVYEAWLNGEEFRVNTSDMTGTLRMKKTGTTIQAFYLGPSGWQLFGSSTNSQFAQATSIFIGSLNYPNPGASPTKDIKVAFDNLRITNCPANMSSILPLLME